MAISKQIQGYPEYYVTSAGNVWSKKENEFYLKLRPSKLGRVNLYTNGERKTMLVHRLVATAFVPIPEKYADMSIDELDIHHVDFNHSNNRESNLMWLTKTEHKKLHNESDVTFKRRSKAKKGKHHSEETKQKMSETHQGEKNPMYGKPRPEGAGKPPKQVAQYTKEGEFVAEYASISEASRLTKANHRNICKCCSGKLKSSGGYKWAYLD